MASMRSRHVPLMAAFLVVFASVVAAEARKGSVLLSGAEIVWVGYFEEASGMGEEARQSVIGLIKAGINVTTHSLSNTNQKSKVRLSKDDSKLLKKASRREVQGDNVIVVYHTVPGMLAQTTGPNLANVDKKINKPISYRIGRFTFETDSLPSDWVSVCNQMDEVWVPSQLNMDGFANAGVAREKLFKIPEPLDTDTYSREKIRPKSVRALRRDMCGEDDEDEPEPMGENWERKNDCVVFLAVFDWQWRKAWNILIYSFILEFEHFFNVRLALKVSGHTVPGLNIDGIKNEANQMIKMGKLAEKLPSNIVFLDDNFASDYLPNIYAAADAFVLPSRGEGWGRPIVDAMSMGLPVITTEWGGPLDYLNETSGYLVRNILEPAKDPRLYFPKDSGNWAKPTASDLRFLMRDIVDKPRAAHRRAQIGRSHVRELYNRARVAQLMLQRLEEAAGKLSAA